MSGAQQRPLVPWGDTEAHQLPPHMLLYDHAPVSAPYDPPAGPSTIPDDDGDEENVFRDMTFEEVLEDLNARFLVNLPEEELTLVRLYWQAEQAHWFYEDYLRPLNPQLPALSQRHFTQLIIASSPLYANWEIDYDAVWAEYCAYKKMVPCCGGILLNQDGDKVLMVRGWKANAGWCFPRGKINSEESDAACAIREVEEETGFDMTDLIDPNSFIKTQVNAQDITMFLVLGIDESTVFETQTRKEIGAIEWVPLVDLPVWSNKKGPKRTGGKAQKKFYNVTPFVGGIKKFLTKNGINPHQPRRKERSGGSGGRQQQSRNDNGGRNLQPFAFDSAPPQPGRELQPFTFGDVPEPSGTPSTAIDHLFAKFIQKDDNAVALESSTARTMDQLFCAPLEEEDKNDDDVLARLLGNIGTVSDDPAPSLPQPDNKQSKLLSVLHMKPPAPAPASPPRSSHQHNLLSMLASPPKTASDDEERVNRQRALLESTLLGYPASPSAQVQPHGVSPHPHGASPLPHSAGMSPMPQLPASQGQPQGWSPYPPSHTPTAPPPVPRTRPQPPMQPPPPPHMIPQHQPQLDQYAVQPHTPPAQPPRTDHQRNLLGTLFAKPPAGHFAAPPPGHAQPPISPAGYPLGPGPRGVAPNQPPYGAPHYAHPPPLHHAPAHMGHQRQLSGGLPGQPGQGRPIGGAIGIPGQPGQPIQMAGWGNMPPGIPPIHYGQHVPNVQGFPGQPPQPPQPYQQQQQQQQQPPPPPARSTQTPPAMHQPVARPPVSGSLLGLAAGR